MRQGTVLTCRSDVVCRRPISPVVTEDTCRSTNVSSGDEAYDTDKLILVNFDEANIMLLIFSKLFVVSKILY